MAAATAGWLVYPPPGKLQATAQRLVCWSNYDKRIQVGTGGGTHFVVPLDVCDGTPLELTPGTPTVVCAEPEPTGWVVVTNLDPDDVSGINPNTCAQTPAPTGLAVSNETDTSMDLAWDPVAGADDYRVRYRIQGSEDPWTEFFVGTPPTDLTGLTASTTYDITVQARVDGVLGLVASTTGTTTA